jgi:hypothetical protein
LTGCHLHREKGVRLAVVSDFVVIGDLSGATKGKWLSRPFEAGGHRTLTVEGQEYDNAYITAVVTSPKGGQDVELRFIINGHPQPNLMWCPANDMRTLVVAFPASVLNESNNVLELHSRREVHFNVIHAMCHFRQNA